MPVVNPKTERWLELTETRFRVLWEMANANGIVRPLERMPGASKPGTERMVSCAIDAKKQLGRLASFCGALDYALLTMVCGMGLNFKDAASRYFQTREPSGAERRYVAKRYKDAAAMAAVEFCYATGRHFDAVPGFDGSPDE